MESVTDYKYSTSTFGVACLLCLCRLLQQLVGSDNATAQPLVDHCSQTGLILAFENAKDMKVFFYREFFSTVTGQDMHVLLESIEKSEAFSSSDSSSCCVLTEESDLSGRVPSTFWPYNATYRNYRCLTKRTYSGHD